MAGTTVIWRNREGKMTKSAIWTALCGVNLPSTSKSFVPFSFQKVTDGSVGIAVAYGKVDLAKAIGQINLNLRINA
ncbi:hypothetical protein Nepgr_026100 [Nepenthes gracilis]|uniref:Uncharacterized protein n=1 Tax=Nepenthes gracilis TaxID=150966 RepID=A0AAD3T923_NEPGR|nr:hypothetical protein Nepgr_026100 [Nepenthes gracilis]